MTRKEISCGNVFFLLLLLMVGGFQYARAEVSSQKPPAAYQGPKKVLFFPWGKGDRQAGKLEREEGASAGPSSFAVLSTGEFYLLDQVNARVLKFNADGSPAARIAIPVAKPECKEGSSFNDIEVSQDGKIILLDRDVRKVIVLLDPTGKEISSYDFVKLGITDPGNVIGLSLYKDGLYLQEGDGNYIRVLDNVLKPSKGDPFPGVIYKGGAIALQASITRDEGDSKQTLRLWDGKTDRTLKEVPLPPGLYWGISFLSPDSNNHIHVVLSFEKEDKKTFKVTESGFMGLKFDENFNEIARLRYATPKDHHGGLDYFQNFNITHEGKLYHMIFTKKGVQVLRWE